MSTLKVISSVLGVFFILASLLSLFLYETEEGIVQNKLEVLWIRLSEAESAALSKQAKFIQAIADLTDGLFNRVFGNALVSSQSVAVSACFSLFSLGIVCSPGIYDLPFPDIIIGLYGPVVLLLFIAGILPAILRTKLPRKIWFLGVALLCGASFVGMYRIDWFGEVLSTANPIRELNYDAVFLLLTISSDALFVVANRWLLRRASSSHSSARILGTVLGNVGLALLLVLLPLIRPLQSGGDLNLWKARHDLVNLFEKQAMFSTSSNIFLLTLAASNLFDAAVSFAFVGLFLVMLLHWLLWPALQRPVYAIAKGDLARRRKLFLALGTTLIAIGTPTGLVVRLGRLLKRIVETLLSS